MTRFTRPLALILIVSALSGHSSAWAGGSNIGGTPRGSALVSEWCRGALGVLDAAETQARMAEIEQDFNGARDILKQGLLEALRRDQGGASLTHQSMVRGLEMSDALDASLKTLGNDPRHAEASVDFLKKYYDFVRKVADEVDLNYYIPYYNSWDNCRNNCSNFDVEQFEKRFVTYAREQVEFVLNNFSNVARGQVTPVWSAATFLKLLEYTTKYAAEDLSLSLWATGFSCVTERFGKLNDNLSKFNVGNRIVYRNDRYAVNMSYGEAWSAAQAIEFKCSTSARYPNQPNRPYRR